MLASAVAVPVVSFSLEAKICTIAVPVGSGLITVKLQISLLLVLVHGRPCSIVYICRSISTSISCDPGAPTYGPVLTLGSSIPNYHHHHAHLNPLVFKYHFSWLVCCSAVVSTSRSCTNDQLVFQRCLSLGHFCVQCHVWRRRFCLILFRL